MIEKNVRFSTKSDVFLEPVGAQRRNVPHFKGLINAKVDLGAQGRDTTFTLCHAQLR